MRITLLFLLSFVLQFIIIQASRKWAFCVDAGESEKPQRLHTFSTARAGGLGIFFSTLIPFSLLGDNAEALMLASLPVFAAGFYEDFRTGLSPAKRLLLMSCGPAAFILLSGDAIVSIGFLALPFALAAPFTVFAVVGVANAMNVIDGVNGLASGVSIIALIFLAAISYIYGDQLVLNISVVLIVSIAGFFVWNYPKGKIFLGDGGAYFIGFLLAETSVLLVDRNSAISPWFPMVLLVYPVFEVFFSIYRRRIKRRGSAMAADSFHLHTLICKRVTKSNSRTSVYLWALVWVFGSAAFIFHANTPALVAIVIVFAAVYVFIYRRIIRFNNPF